MLMKEKINPRGKTIHLAKLRVRNEATDGSPVPEDECLFDFIISNGEEDSYGSFMTEKTLKNYAEDAERSVPFMIDHKDGVNEQVGQTISAYYDPENKQTIATVRMLRDSDDTPDHLKVNEYIRRIERGMYRGVSVAFRDAKEICNICSKPIFDVYRDDHCPHVPKQYYDGVKCTYNVDDARLREVSLTSNPSNPNAQLLDTRNWHEDLLFGKDLGIGEDGKEPEGLVKSQLEKDGETYRLEVVNNAIKEGVRAIDDFNEQQWRDKFKSMELDTIKYQTELWRQIADNRWGPGGRQTSDDSVEPTSGVSNDYLPSFIFD